MITKERANEVIGSTLYGSGNEKIGKVGHIFLDNRSGQPQFATVRTGMFGTRESFVPLDRAESRDGQVYVPHEAQQVKDAPNVDAEQGELSQQEEQRLYEHYGMTYGESGAAAASGGVGTTGETGRQETDGDAMTRSEERVHVGKESRETGRARLRKYVVTENVEQTVPVSHEEVRVEREPITEENRGEAQRGPAFTEAEHEVTLHEERPVVSKEEVPVERVRLEKDTQTEQEQVSEEVRKEQIEEDIPSGDDERSR